VVIRKSFTVIHNPVNKIISDAAIDEMYEGLEKDHYFFMRRPSGKSEGFSLRNSFIFNDCKELF